MYECVLPLTVQSWAQTTSPSGCTLWLCGNSKSMVKVTLAAVRVGESLSTLKVTLPPGNRKQWGTRNVQLCVSKYVPQIKYINLTFWLFSFRSINLSIRGIPRLSEGIFVACQYSLSLYCHYLTKRPNIISSDTFPGVFVSRVSIFPDWVHLIVPWWITSEAVSGLWNYKNKH